MYKLINSFFKPYNRFLHYRKKVVKTSFFLICIIFFTSLTSFAQELTVSGKVESEDGQGIPGTAIVIKGTDDGVISDAEGNYTISVNAGQTLVFSFIGMQTEEVVVTNQAQINIVLEADITALDEIFVVAYGTAKKSAFTGSATQINSDEIEYRPITTLTSAIEGASAGVTTTSGSGQPGDGPSIVVRGIGTITGSSNPLYIVDGAPFSGYINSINPGDIESISILKDAASTALYGNRASNGVVLITTKKGRKEAGTLRLDVSTGIIGRAIPEYDRVGVKEYYELMWESIRNERITAGLNEDVASQYATDNLISAVRSNVLNVPDNEVVGIDGLINPDAQILEGYSDLDWENEMMKTGFRKNYSLSYSGGTEKTDYYASLAYLDTEGFVIESDFKRVNGRININHQATNWFKTGFNIAAANSTSKQSRDESNTSSGNPFRITRKMGPLYPVYEHDPTTGEYILDSNGDKIYGLNNDRPASLWPGRHIVAETKWDTDIDEITSVSAKPYGEITFLKDFKFTANLSYDQRHFYNTRYQNDRVGEGQGTGISGRRYTRRTSLNFNQLLNYSKSFDSGNLSVLLGHESYEMIYNNFYGNKTGQSVSNNDELDNFVNITGLGSRTDTYATEGFFSRVNYDYYGKYFISGSFRRDGSSKLAKETRWGNFWSVGLAWKLDQEQFIKQFGWINMLKLRTSYGEVGSDQGLGYYEYQSLYDLGFDNGTEAGVLQGSLASKDVKWESNNTFDAGLEFRVFNRLSGTVEYYHKNTDELIFDVPVPLSSGGTDIAQNIGAIVNKGIELSLSYDAIVRKDFHWNISANISTNENVITKLAVEEEVVGSKKLKEGHSIYDYWLIDWYGVDPTDGTALYVADNIEDPNNRIIGTDTLTSNINNARYHYSGSAIPDIYGSFTNTFTYKNFDLGFMFTYSVGGLVLDYNYASIMSSGDYGTALSVDILDRWQKPGDKTNVPRMDNGQLTNFGTTSDRWLVDRSYLNLKQMHIGYQLPQKFIAPIKISSARIYVSGENIIMLSKRKGMSVQEKFNGTTSNTYPPSRIITFGINVNF